MQRLLRLWASDDSYDLLYCPVPAGLASGNRRWQSGKNMYKNEEVATSGFIFVNPGAATRPPLILENICNRLGSHDFSWRTRLGSFVAIS